MWSRHTQQVAWLLLPTASPSSHVFLSQFYPLSHLATHRKWFQCLTIWLSAQMKSYTLFNSIMSFILHDNQTKAWHDKLFPLHGIYTRPDQTHTNPSLSIWILDSPDQSSRPGTTCWPSSPQLVLVGWKWVRRVLWASGSGVDTAGLEGVNGGL